MLAEQVMRRDHVMVEDLNQALSEEFKTELDMKQELLDDTEEMMLEKIVSFNFDFEPF